MRHSIIHRLIGLAILALAPVSAAHAQQAAVRGDVNGDGRVTPADAQAVRDHVAGRPAQPGITLLPNGDANGDGRITGVDAAIIQAFAAGRAPARFGLGRPVAADGKGGSLVMLFECTVDVEAGTHTCGTPRPAGAAADVILARPQIGVVTTGATASRGNSADEDTSSANIALVNNLEQPIGTTDGTTAAASGNRVFFHDGPRVTSVSSGTLASASVRLEGTDGTADFQSPDGSVVHTGKAYIQYNGVLAKGATSSAKPWTFIYTPNTKSFRYAYLVSAPVRYEYGWAVITPSALVLRAGEASSPLAAKVYDHTGAELAEGVTWASSDTAVAKVDSTTGVVTGVTLGTATITATSTVKPQRTASITVSVGALWTGTASSDWSSAANWLGGVVADSTRDATIPASSPNTPKLTVNGSVLTLVANGPVNLGGFTLQVHGALEGTGTISNGNLWYRGSELQGNTPSLLITSGVSLHGPTKATGPVSIQNGSLEISGAPLSISIP